MNLSEFKELPILGILRGISEENLESLIKAIISSGLKTIEITLNTPHADRLIKKSKEISKDALTIGAGTVLNLKDLEMALTAGASFIVCPHFNPQIVKECVKRSIPIFPGALTPQEILTAWDAGAAMIKIFPSNVFGPTYFKDIHGPFENIKLLACGGVNASNIKTYFTNGASAVAFGGSIFNPDWICNGQFLTIQKKIEELINSMRA